MVSMEREYEGGVEQGRHVSAKFSRQAAGRLERIPFVASSGLLLHSRPTRRASLTAEAISSYPASSRRNQYPGSRFTVYLSFHKDLYAPKRRFTVLKSFHRQYRAFYIWFRVSF